MRKKVTLFTAKSFATLLISACGPYGFGCGDGWRPMPDFRYFGRKWRNVYGDAFNRHPGCW